MIALAACPKKISERKYIPFTNSTTAQKKNKRTQKTTPHPKAPSQPQHPLIKSANQPPAVRSRVEARMRFNIRSRTRATHQRSGNGQKTPFPKKTSAPQNPHLSSLRAPAPSLIPPPRQNQNKRTKKTKRTKTKPNPPCKQRPKKKALYRQRYRAKKHRKNPTIQRATALPPLFFFQFSVFS